jgi:hypothetical protein
MVNRAMSAAIVLACASPHPPEARPVTAQHPCPDSGKSSTRDSIDLTHDIRPGPRIRIDSSGALHPLSPVPVRRDSAPCSGASDTARGSSAPS